MVVRRSQRERMGGLLSIWRQLGVNGLQVLFVLCAIGCLAFNARNAVAAEKAISWQGVHPEIRDQVQAVTRSVSDVLRVRAQDVDYDRNGGASLPYLNTRDFDHSFRASFTLRGVDKDGKKLQPDAKTQRGDEYGRTWFTLRVRNLKGLPPEEALREMREGRRLAEAVHDLEMRSFWLKYNLVRTAKDIEAGVKALREQGRRFKDRKIRKALQARAKARQLANQPKIQAAGDKAKKGLRETSTSLASAKEREKKWLTAQKLRLLDARESWLRLELEVRRRKYEEGVARLRENAAANPKLQQSLAARLESMEKSFGRFESHTNEQREKIANRRAFLKGEPKVKERSPGGRVKDSGAASFFKRARKREMGTLEGAQFSLVYHPGPLETVE